MTLPGFFDRYRAALRDEPRARRYLLASLIDDIGVAVTTWATALLMTGLFTDQRARARMMIPSLLCFLAGTVVAGPLADWTSATLAQLPRWRWRVVLWARGVETLALGALIFAVRGGAPTIARVLPYVMVSAFMKTALRPTRLAFEVDLLTREQDLLGDDGAALRDERGAPRRYKTHLLAMSALTAALRAAAVLLGLLLGARILGAARGSYVPLLAVDVGTNLAFIAAVALGCRPPEGASADYDASASGSVAPGARAGLVRHFAASLRDGARFLLRRDQRALLALLAGTWLVEVVNETYDARMIVRHVLHSTPDELRHAELAWSVVAVVGALALPALARRVGGLGRLFLAAMLLDGVVIALAGHLAGSGTARAVLPFTAALAADKTLTLGSSTLAELAQNSASSAAMRGRIAAFYAFVVLLGDLAAEIVATGVSERVGIPAMLVRVGLIQVGLVGLIAAGGGRALWSFGLRTRAEPEVAARPALAAPRV